MRRLVLASFCAVAAISCSTTPPPASSGTTHAAGSPPPARAEEWSQHGHDSSEQRYSTLNQVNADNVARLGLAWAVDMPQKGQWQSTPIEVDGRIYVTTPWSYINAFDARTGKLLWTYNPQVPREMAATSLCCNNSNRGAAYWNGKVIWGTLDGRLVAVDAKSGKKVWETQTTDPKDAMSITGAPHLGDGMVFIGQAGGEYEQRGFMSAYNADTGKFLWKFYTVPGDPSKGPDHAASDDVMPMAAKTWTGQWWKAGGGGTPWDGIAYDAQDDLVIFGTGNGAPWPAGLRSPDGGDNLFTSSIVAVHARTGKYAWHYQTVPMDSFDFDNTAPLTLADITVDGQKKHVVMQVPKNGIFYVIEAGTGKVISAQLTVPFANWLTGFDKTSNWKPILNPDANYGKTGKGWFVIPFQVHVWNPQSFNPDTGLFYLTVRNASYGMVAEAGAKMGNQLLWINVGKQPEVPRPTVPGPQGSWLVAWNPATQKEVWRVTPGASAGTMTTAGNLVFQPNGQDLVAYSADKGQKLWSGAMGVGNVSSGPITYMLDGTQYVAVAGGGRLVVFKIGGNAALPPAAAAVRQVLNPVANFGTEAQVSSGKDKYTQNCSICHEDGRNMNNAPDLRYSPFINSADAFRSVVIDGIKTEGGMLSFKKALSAEDVEAIRAHLVSMANTLKANPQPAGGFGGFGGAGGPGGARRPGGAGGGAQPQPEEPAVGLHQ